MEILLNSVSYSFNTNFSLIDRAGGEQHTLLRLAALALPQRADGGFHGWLCRRTDSHPAWRIAECGMVPSRPPAQAARETVYCPSPHRRLERLKNRIIESTSISPHNAGSSQKQRAATPLLFQRRGWGGLSILSQPIEEREVRSFFYKPPLPLLWKRRGVAAHGSLR